MAHTSVRTRCANASLLGLLLHRAECSDWLLLCWALRPARAVGVEFALVPLLHKLRLLLALRVKGQG